MTKSLSIEANGLLTWIMTSVRATCFSVSCAEVGRLIANDLQMVQVELFTADQVHAQRLAGVAAKQWKVDAALPSAGPTANDHGGEGEFQRGTGEQRALAQQLVGRDQLFGYDLMKRSDHDVSLGKTHGGWVESSEFVKHGVDDPLTDGEFVHPAKLTKRVVLVNKAVIGERRRGRRNGSGPSTRAPETRGGG